MVRRSSTMTMRRPKTLRSKARQAAPSPAKAVCMTAVAGHPAEDRGREEQSDDRAA